MVLGLGAQLYSTRATIAHIQVSTCFATRKEVAELGLCIHFLCFGKSMHENSALWKYLEMQYEIDNDKSTTDI